MAETKDLALGAYEVTWTLRDHSSFTARIRVYNAGITCLSVTGGSCNQSTPPGVTISGWHVRGYLRSSVAPPPPPPPEDTINEAGVLAELKNKGAIDTAQLPKRVLTNTWYYFMGLIAYSLSGYAKWIGLRGNPPTSVELRRNRVVVSELDREWVLTQLAKLPYGAAPPPPPPPPEDKITKAGIISELKQKGAINLSQVSTTSGTNKWYYMSRSGYISYTTGQRQITFKNVNTQNPPSGTGNVYLIENRRSVNELDREWVMTQLAKLPYGAAPPPPPPPPEDTINEAGILAELKNKGAIDTAQLPKRVLTNTWYYFMGLIAYSLSGYAKWIGLRGNPPTSVELRRNRVVVSELDREWVLTQLAKLPYGAAPPPPPPPPEDKITKAGIISELKQKGAINLSQVSTTSGTNKWYYMSRSGYISYTTGQRQITFKNVNTQNPPSGTGNVYLIENRRSVNELDREWVMTQLAKLPYGAAPPPPPPPPEDTINEAGILAELKNKGAIDTAQLPKRVLTNTWYYFMGLIAYSLSGYAKWIGLRGNPPTSVELRRNRVVVSELDREWVLTQLAKLPYGAAPPPPPPPPEGLKGWIDGVDVHKLTKDYAKYIWFVSRGRTSDANELRNRLSPKPAEIPTEAATRTNAKGVWFYSKGRFTDGNALLGLNYG